PQAPLPVLPRRRLRPGGVAQQLLPQGPRGPRAPGYRRGPDGGRSATRRPGDVATRPLGPAVLQRVDATDPVRVDAGRVDLGGGRGDRTRSAVDTTVTGRLGPGAPARPGRGGRDLRTRPSVAAGPARTPTDFQDQEKEGFSHREMSS